MFANASSNNDAAIIILKSKFNPILNSKIVHLHCIFYILNYYIHDCLI